MMQKLMNRRNKKGFTLIELIVVIAIIAILAAIAVPRLNGFKAGAEAKANLANIATIESALQVYLLDGSHTGDYTAATLSSTGAVAGTDVTAGNIVPTYLKAMPLQPGSTTKTYTKAASGEVVKE